MKNYLLIITMSLSYYSLGQRCVLNRAGLDIGSGATKLKIAQVDSCKNKVLEILLDKSFAVEYKSDLKKSKDNAFSKSILSKGEESFKSIQNLMKEYKVSEVKAVATSAFRTSNNSKQVVDIAKKYGINVSIITQKEEALLGYKAARSLSGSNNYIVWDIGGGSMQMVYKLNTKELIYEGHLASVPFREYILKEVQKTTKVSPNPISIQVMAKSLKYAQKYALKDLSEGFKALYRRKSIDVVGIGGVHSKAILKAMGRDKYYTKSQLKKFLEKQRQLNDQELGGKYASTSVSNLILVLGFMNALNINKVITGNINLSDGLLLN